MKRYEIELDEAISNFFEEIAGIAQCPIEEILSDALFKQIEIISRNVLRDTIINDEYLPFPDRN